MPQSGTSSTTKAEIEALELLVRLSRPSGGVDVSGDPVLVWRPSDPSGDHANVFTTWPALAAAKATLNGRVWIVPDAAFSSSFHITTGNWNVDGVTFSSLSLFQTITCDDGAHLIWGRLTLDACELLAAGTTPITTVSSFCVLLLDNGAQIQGGASAPALHINATPGLFMHIDASRGAWIGDSVTHRSTIDVGAGALAVIVANDGGTLGTGSETRVWLNSLSGAGTADVTIADAGLDAQTVTTLIRRLAVTAERVGYSATSAPDWNNSPPNDVGGALDRIAAKIGPIA